ncbi:MAG: magnesium-translocating P-type ATPase [Actinomycetia bacterium]|nr:magnesium-translocating P-type ATPase [Actinomycetes bacterium]
MTSATPTDSSTTAGTGLTSTEAAHRLALGGPNQIGADRHAGDLKLLVRQFANPIVLLLVAASVLSLFLGDTIDAGIILAIIVASAALGFTQERGAVHAIRALLASVQIHADVIRDGVETEVPIEGVVIGDIVVLRAGDVVPADAQLLTADDLHVDESALTGESYPARKQIGERDAGVDEPSRRSSVFLGTHVVSGYARAEVTATGAATRLGKIGTELSQTEPPTTFERGLRSFGYLLMRVGALLVVAVFVINLAFDRPVLDSMLFSMALAIGITPQLLPAIVTLTLSRGARQMARERVIIKRLSSIEDFGSIDVLCVDKTGTLTVGSVRMEAALGVTGEPDPRVAQLAWQNAHHQNGFSNPIDQAILASVEEEPQQLGSKIAEVPYDFIRKRLSVAVRTDGGATLVTKGALTSVRSVCSSARLADGTVVPLAHVGADLDAMLEKFSSHGLRTLGVATRSLPPSTTTCAIDDETEMVLVGLVTFADPPKAGAEATLERLAAAGVAVKMITGDNRFAAQHVADAVGLGTGAVVTGRDIDQLDDIGLESCVATTTVFAETEPPHKERIVRALSRSGHSVGFLGDGINDALAIRAADVGISVDTAVDVAKESAAVVLLDKDLDVLLAGIRRGRQSFANTLKYVFVTTSANFGNMVSMAGATLMLPFLPLLPRQILLLNFVSDIPASTIASDAVDEEQLTRPTHWDIHFVRNFMLVFGLVSSCFDYLTFAVLRLAFPDSSTLFRTGWFIVSVTTELLVMLILRTRRSFIRSRPSTALLASSATVAILTLIIPFTFAAHDLGFERPPARMLAALAAVLIGYVAATEAAKRVFYRRITTSR